MSPPHQPPPWPPYPSSDVWTMLLHRLLEGSEQTRASLARIDSRLETGDERMDQMSRDIAELKARKPEPLPNWERAIKSMLPYVIFMSALAGTGSIDASIKVLQALTKAP